MEPCPVEPLLILVNLAVDASRVSRRLEDESWVSERCRALLLGWVGRCLLPDAGPPGREL